MVSTETPAEQGTLLDVMSADLQEPVPDPEEMLGNLERRGITLRVNDDGSLAISGIAGTMTSKDRDLIKQHRDALIGALAQRAVVHEIEPEPVPEEDAEPGPGLSPGLEPEPESEAVVISIDRLKAVTNEVEAAFNTIHARHCEYILFIDGCFKAQNKSGFDQAVERYEEMMVSLLRAALEIKESDHADDVD